MTDSSSPLTPLPAEPAQAGAGPRIALVTGAARRIGRSIALALARGGWDIAVHCGASLDEARAVAGEIEALGRRAAVLPADLADEAAAAGLIERCRQALGLPDCVVNNASLFAYDTPETFGYAALARHAAINTGAPLVLARELHRALPDDGRAVIINLLDQKLVNMNPDYLSYTLSKAALQAATVALAQAFAPKLRVVGVAPGITLVSGSQSAENFAVAHRQTPLGRSSTPDDIAQAVAYLAQAPAVTGTVLMVDGGQHLQPSLRDVMFAIESP
ncbi:SDR family oxidoreductase [Pandoraea sp.]|uniref:SDR family oxidoreductase n=1 Tax=Pandoraea sp. TaxID=1883445 RepID=UPI0011FEA980|nr:SDR family oxidoreductase [Pandoraea sp.]MDE2289658.1 SDR family oxidoreductase [Burkholderiales bacterium]TAL57342.1 MAG: SDR family oxidoreductase [Pandoraea sp.]TAM16409.1 MAG: SDR family oxidoreductase [Pandoraea sp.]